MSDEIRKIISLTEAANRVTNEDNGKMPTPGISTRGMGSMSAPMKGDGMPMPPTKATDKPAGDPPKKPELYKDPKDLEGVSKEEADWLTYWWDNGEGPFQQDSNPDDDTELQQAYKKHREDWGEGGWVFI
jgi:hypothetical protein